MTYSGQDVIARETEARQLISTVLERRMRGVSLHNIAKELGISLPMVARLERQGLAEYTANIRVTAAERLAQLTGVLETVIDKMMPNVETGSAPAAEKVIQAVKTLAELHGLNAPQVNINATLVDSIATLSPEDKLERLKQLIASGNARAQLAPPQSLEAGQAVPSNGADPYVDMPLADKAP